MSFESGIPERHHSTHTNGVDKQPVTAFQVSRDRLSKATSAESDEPAIAKAPTLMIDQPAEHAGETCHIPEMHIHYIQGVVQGNQAFIITNLLMRESIVIQQPQMVWTIGRNRDAAIPLQDRAMSRRHAVLLHVPSVGFQLIDLNSMNGSYINGKRIRHRSFLHDGDRLRLGSTDFIFFFSRQRRLAEALHPEVLARLTSEKSYSPRDKHVDYLELKDPEVFFQAPK